MVTIELKATRPAHTLSELLSPYHEQVPFIGTLGFFPASLSLGGLASVLGRYDEAEAHFTEAAELAARGQMQFFAARTQLDWGRMLALRGRPGDLDGAGAHLEQALGVALSLGYSGIERKANTELLNLA
jgi:hypothetical protein